MTTLTEKEKAMLKFTEAERARMGNIEDLELVEITEGNQDKANIIFNANIRVAEEDE